MSDIACGSAPQDFKRRFLERISAYTIEYIHKCKILTNTGNYFKVITLQDLFSYSIVAMTEMNYVEWVVSVLILDVLIVIFFIKFFKN